MLMTCRTAEALRQKSKPVMATVLLTYSCSNDCVFCGPADKRRETDGKAAEREEVIAWLERCRDAGVNLMVFSGAADPFTHKDLNEFVSLAASWEMHPFCYTQAHASERRIRELRDAGLEEIMVSVHGHNALVHERNTRSFGSFRRTLDGLAHIREAGFYTMTNTVVTRYNVDHLDELVDLLAFEQGVDEMAFSFPRVEGSVWTNQQCIPEFSRAAQALDRVLPRLREAGKRATVEYMPSCYLDPSLYEVMPDFPTHYRDASHEIVIKPSEVEWNYPMCCEGCKQRERGCQGVDRHLPFDFMSGPLRELG